MTDEWLSGFALGLICFCIGRHARCLIDEKIDDYRTWKFKCQKSPLPRLLTNLFLP